MFLLKGIKSLNASCLQVAVLLALEEEIEFIVEGEGKFLQLTKKRRYV